MVQTIKCTKYTGLSALPDDAAVTMAYVPFQLDWSMYDNDTALEIGTLFPDLDKPFKRGSERCE